MSRTERRVNLFRAATGFVSLVLFLTYLATNEPAFLGVGVLALLASAGTGRFFKRSLSDLSPTSARDSSSNSTQAKPKPKPKDEELAKGLADYRVTGVDSPRKNSSDRKWEFKVNLMFGLFIFVPLALVTAGIAIPLMFPPGEMTYEEVDASPHKVVERDDLDFSGTRFTYVNPQGGEVPLSVVCGDGLTAKPCVSSEDGSVKFSYGADRSGLYLESEIVLDGEVMPSECHFPSGVVPTGWTGKVCAPLPASD